MATISLEPLGTYATGLFDEGGAEIVAHDPATQRLFVVNRGGVQLDVLDIADPSAPTKLFDIDLSPFGATPASVAVHGGIVAAAVWAADRTMPGQVALFDPDGALLKAVTVGAEPDMVIFTPDGSKILVANEGEPVDDADPEGSVSIIDVSGGAAAATVTEVSFAGFNGQEAALRAEGVRLFPGKTVAQNVEPEYIAISGDGGTAFVTLEDNNAIAAVDIPTATVRDILPLGLRDYSKDGGLDPSEADQTIDIANHPVFGMYMPDAIAAYEVGGKTYYATANEGDTKGEEARVWELKLDPEAFPNAEELQQREVLGDLRVSTIDGDPDGDGDYDQLYAYGTRSFSIWDAEGRLVFDSGDDFEQITAEQFPAYFNVGNDDIQFDDRSDARGPEPEGITVGEVAGRSYAFTVLEQIGGVMVYDVTDPRNASFVQYINTRDFTGDMEAGTAGDLGPEGVTFIAAADSPTEAPLLVVANEVSGTTTIFAIDAPDQVLTGTGDADTLVGDGGNDRILGGRGDDLLSGLGGADVVTGDEGDDQLDGGQGDDRLRGNAEDDVIDGAAGADTIGGNGGDDTIAGGAGDDSLNGGQGNDVIRGDEGADTIAGASGKDVLFGGAGADVLAFGASSSSGQQTDVIVDFENGVDVISLDGLTLGSLFTGSGPGTANGVDLQNDAGIADTRITLSNGHRIWVIDASVSADDTV